MLQVKTKLKIHFHPGSTTWPISVPSKIQNSLKKDSLLRNNASGPDFGRTATGKTPTSALRPDFDRSEARFRCFPGSSPAKIRPGSPIPGPEALFPPKVQPPQIADCQGPEKTWWTPAPAGLRAGRACGRGGIKCKIKSFASPVPAVLNLAAVNLGN